MKISFIMPGRNNLKYARWSYDSIQKNKGYHQVEICFADDNSNDGTWEWCQEMIVKDPNFKAIRNDSGQRVGHTILYDRLIKEVATSEVAIIWHCDMYLCPGALDEVEGYLYTAVHTDHVIGGFDYIPKYKTIVSLTRIEPPLHPDGPEKQIANWGSEPEEFNEAAFLQWFLYPEADGFRPKRNEPTNGIFAPWAFFVKDFKEIGGHDPLYRPQSKEDSDIFNRFKLNGVTFIQTWKGFVYHMTCKGSRFNPTLTIAGINSKEWEEHNIKSTRNFIRKWGTVVQHNEYLNPTISPKFNVEFRITNSTLRLIEILEPFCDSLRCDLDKDLLQQYLYNESKKTDFDLGLKISGNILPDVTVYIDCSKFTEADYSYINNLGSIVFGSNIEDDHSYSIGTLNVFVHKKINRVNDLIHINDKNYKFKLR